MVVLFLFAEIEAFKFIDQLAQGLYVGQVGGLLGLHGMYEYLVAYLEFMQVFFLGFFRFTGFDALLQEVSGKLIVAGGLNRENVCTVIKELNPFGVDVSSGVEKDGVKDFELMKKFMQAVKNCLN